MFIIRITQLCCNATSVSTRISGNWHCRVISISFVFYRVILTLITLLTSHWELVFSAMILLHIYRVKNIFFVRWEQKVKMILQAQANLMARWVFAFHLA